MSHDADRAPRRSERGMEEEGARGPGLSRREFVGLCTLALPCASAAARTGTGASRAHFHERVALVDRSRRSITAESLTPATTYVFEYPYRVTPCFLLDLGEPVEGGNGLRTEDGGTYVWEGGVGPRRSIVAFAAICAHRLTYPAHSVTFINYRRGPVPYLDAEERPATGEHVIYCCSERSVYDVRSGARVLGGPARQPLAAIVLEESPQGALFAVGTLGGELYDEFFRRFGFQLALEYRTQAIRVPVRGETPVVLLEEYSRTIRSC